MLEMITMLVIVVGVFAIGDICGVMTKAKLSSVFVALLLMLIFFMAGLVPADIVSKAGLSEVARWSSPILIFSMGTMIDIKQLIKEWRTVALSCIAMAVTLGSVLLIIPFIGKETALVAVPILNGGIIATQIMTGGALAKGFNIAAAIGTITYATQKFVGSIPASYFGLKEARTLITEYRKNGAQVNSNTKSVAESTNKKIFADTHKAYFTPFVCFAVATIGGWCATYLQSVLNIHNSIIALILGAVVGYYGLVPKNILDYGKSSGFITMIAFAAIIPSLSNIQFGDLVSLSTSLVFIFIAVIIGIYVCIYLLPTWKLIGSRDLAVGVAMGQLLGFPATYLIANEIAQAVGENDDEREYILERIAPAYVVSGMATVTTISIIIAGVMVKFL